MSTTRLTYLPALDGLRAIAVALVVAYHLDLGGATGGFLGVDLFFVISGFLITTLLLREHDRDGRISLRSFWARRFRRLVPPLVVMTAATVAATRVYGLPEQWTSVRWDAAAALGYVANWRFITGGQSYFETLLGPSGLRHTWSLAVEEQWYALWPLVVVALTVLVVRRPRLARLPLVLIGLGAVTSAVLMAALYEPADPTRVYFGTDTRAQQLLVGAGLAWLLVRRGSAAPTAFTRWSRPLVWLCFATFVGIALTVSDEARWLYHGGFLAVSLLAAVIVWAVSTPDGQGPLAWLGNPTLVWLGTRSYGIYLWHWPVIVFVGEPMGIELARWPLAALQVAITLALAETSFRFVERPVRTSTWRPTFVIGSWTAISAATILIAAAVLVPPEGRTLIASEIVTPSTTTTSTTTTVPDGAAAVDLDAADAWAAVTPTPPTVTVPPLKRTALLLGDSTALKVIVDYDRTVPRTWSVEGFATFACTTTEGKPIDVGLDYSVAQADYCLTWRDDWAYWRDAVDPGVSIVMIGAWEVLDHLLDDGPHRFPGDDWTTVVRTAIDDAFEIAGAGGRPVAALTLPCMRWDRNSSVSAEARNDPARVNAFNALLKEVAATKPDVRVLDLAGLLCPGGQYLDEIDGQELRYDGVHVTQAGADVLVGWLTEELDRAFLTPEPAPRQ